MGDDEVIAGKWWKEGAATTVEGELELETEFRLHTHDCLDPVEPEVGVAYAPEYVRLEAVHGRSRGGDEVTLLGVSGTSLRFGMAYTSVHETWRPEAAILGTLVAPETRFSAARIEVGGLAEWAQPPPLVQNWLSADKVKRLDLAETPIMTVKLEDADLTLVALAEGSVGVRSVDVSRRVVFRVALKEPATWQQIRTEWVAPLRQLISILLVDSVPATQVLIRPEGEDEGHAWPELRWAPRDRGQHHDRALFDGEVLFFLPSAPIPIGDFVERWFERSAELHKLVSALVAVDAASFLYAEHTYLLRLAAAESAQRLLGTGTQDVSTEEHAARVDAVISAASSAGVAADHLEWATAVLRSRNDKSLRSRLQELVDATGEVGAQISAASPSFVRDAVRFRTPIAHVGKSGDQDAIKRWRAGEALGWMARTVLLSECGVPKELAAQCVLNHERFRFLVEHLVEGAEGDA